ncbi:cyclic lactone autoinducer peptide [Paenibacillus elgii]
MTSFVGLLAVFFANVNSAWWVHKPEAPKSLLKRF